MLPCLLIFAKNPRPGRVKTRLANTLGDVEALRIYRFLLQKTRETALAVEARRCLRYSDAITQDDEWPEEQFEKFVQEGADLGERMNAAFLRAFDDGAGKAVIIGSDCPELDGALLAEAFSALDASDVVIGPAPDGGYYLLGMRQHQPALFADIVWSTPAVLPATLEKAARLGLKVHLLPELSDIDTETDWRAYLDRRTK